MDAQQRAAKAAELAVASAERQEVFAQRQVWLSFFGILALLVTIGYSIRATNAAVAANEIARDVAKAQLRPYVALEDITFGLERHPVVARVCRVHVNWKNTGQTPTRRMKWNIDYLMTPAGEPIPDGFNFDHITDIEGGYLGPGQSSRDVSTLIQMDDLEPAIERHFDIHLYGWVEYSDSFPKSPRHRTEFCVKLDPIGLRDVFRPETETSHNGADDDCLKRPMTTA